MDKIYSATATCSGGGIYIYTGQLDNGDFFMSNDDFMEYVEFYDADPYEELDEACGEIWQHTHALGGYSGQKAIDFMKSALNWIIQERPEGNYSVSEIESRYSKL